jgi:hypothetical protein
MAHRYRAALSVIDLSGQTITTLDLRKKTYSAMTFDDMNPRAHMKGNDQGQSISTSRSTPPGMAKPAAGFDTEGMILQVTTEGAGEKTGPERWQGHHDRHMGYGGGPRLSASPRLLPPHEAVGTVAADVDNRHNSLQVSLNKRFAKGLTFTTAYTYGNALGYTAANGQLLEPLLQLRPAPLQPPPPVHPQPPLGSPLGQAATRSCAICSVVGK